MSDNTIHLLSELLELVADAADPELELARICVKLRDRQTDQESRNRP